MAILTLRPNGVGWENDLTAVGAATTWEAWDESSSDGDTSYNTSVTGNQASYSTLPPHGLPYGTTINSLTLYTTMRCVTSVDLVYAVISDGNTGEHGTSEDTIGTTYTQYTLVKTTSDLTGNPFTVADLDAIQIGAFVSGSVTRITQIYLEVDYNSSNIPTTNCLILAGD